MMITFACLIFIWMLAHSYLFGRLIGSQLLPGNQHRNRMRLWAQFGIYYGAVSAIVMLTSPFTVRTTDSEDGQVANLGLMCAQAGFGTINRGDLVFVAKRDLKVESVVCRLVVALPGDTLSSSGNKLLLNGALQSYGREITPDQLNALPGIVPSGAVVVCSFRGQELGAGEHTIEMVNAHMIHARALFVMWPPSAWGSMEGRTKGPGN
jgi:hypothetical protein